MDNRVIHSDVLCDETKLREIFLNILSNFLEYTLPNRKDSMNLKEIPSHWPGYAMCQTVIEDKCIGMSEERLSHLFKKFARELSCTEKQLVDQMEGAIEVESKVGGGTKTIVTLSHRIAQYGNVQTLVSKTHELHTESYKGKFIITTRGSFPDRHSVADIAV